MEDTGFFSLILHWFVLALELLFIAAVVPGFRLKGLGAALVIGIANAVVRPVLLFLTFPITIVTFGLFVFVVNAIVLRLCAALLKGFDIKGWMPAIIAAVILAVLRTALYYLLLGFGLPWLASLT